MLLVRRNGSKLGHSTLGLLPLLVIALVVASVFSQDFDTDSSLEMEEEFAQASMERQREMGGVLCHSGMTAVQTFGPLSSNGCTGADMFRFDGQEDFTYCCDLHDVCYQTCGVSRKQCDGDFKRCMADLCKSNFADNEKCPSVASMYYMATSTFGEHAYEDSQSSHCQCVDIRIKAVRAHYEKLIGAFYRDHAPEAAHKFAMEKYEHYKGSPHKWGWLYYSLYSKYDHAIVHEGGRVLKRDVPRPVGSAGTSTGKSKKKGRKCKDKADPDAPSGGEL